MLQAEELADVARAVDQIVARSGGWDAARRAETVVGGGDPAVVAALEEGGYIEPPEAGQPLAPTAAVVRALGRHGSPAPLWQAQHGATAARAIGVADRAKGGRARALGEQVVVHRKGDGSVDGRVPFWPAAGPGQLLLVPDDGGGWCALEADAAGVHLQPLSTAAGKAAASVELAGVAPIATAEGVDGEALRRTGILLAASELVGLADRLVEEARSYAGERHQFGRPVGSFQGLAWMIVEAHVAVDGAGLLVDEALVADERRAEGGAMLAAAAFGTAADAAQRAARTSHQVFGAIGYTTDLPIELLSRRVTVTSRLFGGKRQQWRAVGADVLRLHDRPAQGAPT